MTRSVFCAFLLLVVWLPRAASQSAVPDPSREDVKRLIVRIDSTFPDKDGFGAGIVLGLDNDQVYIVTANHVVREGESAAIKIKVQFRGHKEQVAGQLGAHYDIDQDLAVVTVSGARALGIDGGAFPFDRIGDPTVLIQGEPVFLAGHPQGVPWSVTVTPDAFIEPDEASLRFESKSLFPGHSGGALLNFRLEIIGLLRSDQQPNGDALSIVKVVALLKEWGYPVRLSQRFTAASLETLSVGAGHTCYVNPHGTASCWGGNDHGQLGFGTSVDATQPSPVHGHTVFVSISAGYEHTCAISASAQALCWGDDSSGQLGTTPPAPHAFPLNNPHTSVPTPVYGGLSFRTISAGHDHTCGLTTKGMAYCWGDNEYGQLGTGSKVSSSIPVPVVGGHTFRSVRAGMLFSCGVDDTGSLFCWGENSFGQLGDGSLIKKAIPVAVLSNLKFTSVSVGDAHACAIATSGRAYCWGGTAEGVTSLHGKNDSPIPVAVMGGLTFSSVSAGRGITYAITQKGVAVSWGIGLDELALSEDEGPDNVPKRIFGTPKLLFKALAIGFAHACGLSVSDGIYCWGVNTHGQLGIGSKETTVQPTLVSLQP
jgi:alpha-tubulin suppressor-like RCC1 family protein